MASILDQRFQVRVTTKALRCIDKAGGIDNYLLFTKVPQPPLFLSFPLRLTLYLLARGHGFSNWRRA